MSNQNQAQKDRVDSEQQIVKEKGQEALSAARKIKNGEVDVEIPSTQQVTGALQTGEESLARFQESDRGQQVGPAGQKVIDDIKKVLADEGNLIQQKNEGDVLQNIVRDLIALLQEMKNDGELKEIFEEWQNNLTSLMGTGDFVQFFQQSGELFSSLKDTEEFLELLSQLIDLLKVVVAEKTELATDKDPVALQEFKYQKDIESRRVEKELRATLRALSYNDVWRIFVHQGKEIAEEAKEAGKDTADKAKRAYYCVRDSSNFHHLMDDFKTLLQRLVGNKRSVNPLFDSAKATWEDIINDQELRSVIRDMQSKLSALVDDPALLDNSQFQDEISHLAERGDNAVTKLRNNPNVVKARKESNEIMDAIKHEPASAQLLQDIKTLWRDLASENAGEVVDADVLKSIRSMIVPLLLEHLNNVPLPSIKGRAEFLGKYDYTVEDMKISLPELIPENIHVRFEFEMDANPLELESTNQHTYLYLQASDIQLHLRDSKFSYNRLTLPKHSDSGIFDVDTSGRGLSIWMKLEIKTGTDKEGKSIQYVDVLKSDVRIHKFAINFKESKHDTLYEMLSHLFQSRIKNGVIDLIQEKLKQFGSYFSDQLIILIEQARSKSQLISQMAKDKTEIARKSLENLKLKAENTALEAKAGLSTSQTKEDIKSTAQNLAGIAGEKAQDLLDQQKWKVEQQKQDKELSRTVAAPTENLEFGQFASAKSSQQSL